MDRMSVRLNLLEQQKREKKELYKVNKNQFMKKSDQRKPATVGNLPGQSFKYLLANLDPCHTKTTELASTGILRTRSKPTTKNNTFTLPFHNYSTIGQKLYLTI